MYASVLSGDALVMLSSYTHRRLCKQGLKKDAVKSAGRVTQRPTGLTPFICTVSMVFDPQLPQVAGGAHLRQTPGSNHLEKEVQRV